MQQDLLDTLFLNKKALAGVGGTSTETGPNTTNDPTTTKNITMSANTSTDGAEKCPVDHKSREAWMAQARAAQEAQQQQQQPQQQQQQKPLPQQSPTSTEPKPSSGWGWRIPFFSSTTPTTNTSTTITTTTAPTQHDLGTDRVISSIPRSTDDGATTSACPVNHETETGADPKTGNWVYPSEKMFFDAMKRKGHDTRANDMKTVVPIHNAVNERAWHEIREWERPYATTRYVYFVL